MSKIFTFVKKGKSSKNKKENQNAVRKKEKEVSYLEMKKLYPSIVKIKKSFSPFFEMKTDYQCKNLLFLLQTLFNIVSTSTYALLLLSSKQKTFFKTNIEKTTKALLLTILPKKKWKRCVFLTSHENKSPQKSCEWKANQIKIVKEKTSKSDSVVRFTTIRWTLLSLAV